MNANVQAYADRLPARVREAFIEFVESHPDYPHGDTAFVMDATIYARVIVFGWESLCQ